jgi:crotonobetainyl-CoA:carnitine CoA-transferase CaiB-like acyl-CoA transferase
VFTVKDGEQIFLSAVSDKQWRVLCDAFNWKDLLNDARYCDNNARVRERPTLLADLRARFAAFNAQDLSKIFEQHGLPYAPIKKPHELVDDPHLLATGGLSPITLPSGQQTNTVLFPFTLDGERMGVRLSPPKLGEHSAEILQALGYSAQDAIKLGATCAR